MRSFGDNRGADSIVIYLCRVWIPAEDPVVFSTTQQELRVSLAPGDGQNSPVRKHQQMVYTVYSAKKKTNNRNTKDTQTVKASPCVVLKNFKGWCGKTEVPHLDDWESIILRGQHQLSGHFRMPEHSWAVHLQTDSRWDFLQGATKHFLTCHQIITRDFKKVVKINVAP